MAIKNTLPNMILSLMGITMICSLGVGLVNYVTVEPIKEANQRAVESALQAVLPPFERLESEEAEADGFELDLYTAYGADGEVVGYAANTATLKGYSGLIELIVGLSPEGEVMGVQVVKQNETPGLGSKIKDEGNILISDIMGRNLNSFELKVSKDGGEVDVLTGATITSRACLDAVERGFLALKSNVMKK